MLLNVYYIIGPVWMIPIMLSPFKYYHQVNSLKYASKLLYGLYRCEWKISAPSDSEIISIIIIMKRKL